MNFKRFGEILIVPYKRWYFIKSFKSGSYILTPYLLKKSRLILNSWYALEIGLYDHEHDKFIFSSNSENLYYNNHSEFGVIMNSVNDDEFKEDIPYSFYSFYIKPLEIGEENLIKIIEKK